MSSADDKTKTWKYAIGFGNWKLLITLAIMVLGMKVWSTWVPVLEGDGKYWWETDISF